jgi:hypothetical protein
MTEDIRYLYQKILGARLKVTWVAQAQFNFWVVRLI